MKQFHAIIFVFFVGFIMPVNSHAKGEDIGVIYPDVREPFSTIFASMLDGVLDVHGDDVQSIAVKKELDPQDLVDWIKDNKITRIIAMGSRAQKLVENVKLDVIEVVLGAVTKPPKSDLFNAGLLLTPSPSRVYQQLDDLLPSVRNIYVIYSERSEWYVNIARGLARDWRYNLVAMKTESLSDSVKQYKKILDGIDSESAIWLLQDSLSSDSRLILPQLLEAAWDKQFPVISNSAGHVRRGVLLALYPDPFEFGTDLAHKLKNGNDKGGFSPFEEALKAANTRTAEHLELGWSRKTIRGFNLVFPSE